MFYIHYYHHINIIIIIILHLSFLHLKNIKNIYLSTDKCHDNKIKICHNNFTATNIDIDLKHPTNTEVHIILNCGNASQVNIKMSDAENVKMILKMDNIVGSNVDVDIQKAIRSDFTIMVATSANTPMTVDKD